MKIPEITVLKALYGDAAEEGKARYESLAKHYQELYHNDKMEFFSSPGRTEIVGNHTDHNGGKILAASIDLDTIGAAYPNGTDTIVIVSEGYDKKVIVNTAALEKAPKNCGTVSLVAGMAEAAKKKGFQVSGFNAYISTKVISAAGISSSASFEMLICSMMNYFFNDGKMTCADYAKIGQYAENHFWDKASGLMDQMACAVGGPIQLDFSDDVKYEKVDFDFARFGYDLVIVNTGKGHADLSRVYSEIPEEMKAVAKVLGGEWLADCSYEQLLDHYAEVQKTVGNDRAILRALHYFEENARALAQRNALVSGDFNAFLQLILESGHASFALCQNVYCSTDVRHQGLSVALALSQTLLEGQGGAWRMQGGGFAGTIQAFVPGMLTAKYHDAIEKVFGAGSCYLLRLREQGALRVI